MKSQPRKAFPAESIGERELVRTLAGCFVRDLPPGEVAAIILPATTAVSSWDTVEWLLQQHRCTTIAYRMLSSPEVRQTCSIPDATIERLRQAYAATFMQVAVEPSALHQAVDALTAAGIPALVLKGLVLGVWLYGDPELREHEDIDLLLPESHSEIAHEVLAGLGYRRVTVAEPLPRLSARESLGSVTYQGGGRRIPIDLSFDPLRLFWKPAPGEPEWFAGWWDRRRDVVIGGRPVPTLRPEDQFIHLARHLQFHDFFRVNWFVDVLLLLRREGKTLDWDFIGRTARAGSTHGGLYRTLELIEHAYGVRAPCEAWNALRPSRAVGFLHRRIWPDALTLPRDHIRLGGSPMIPRYVGARGVHPLAALGLLAAHPHWRMNFGYLFRRIFPTRVWLRETYGRDDQRRRSYPVLLRVHWRRMRSLGERVRTRRQPRVP